MTNAPLQLRSFIIFMPINFHLQVDSDNEEEEDGVSLKTKTGGGKPKLSRSERRAAKRQKT